MTHRMKLLRDMMMLLMTLLILFWLLYDHFCIVKLTTYLQKFSMSRKSWRMEKVNPGDVKTEPEELQTIRSNLNLLNITTLDLILKGLLEMLLLPDMNLNTMPL